MAGRDPGQTGRVGPAGIDTDIIGDVGDPGGPETTRGTDLGEIEAGGEGRARDLSCVA